MGLFDLFKTKEKTNMKLLKLQNIVYEQNYDKVIFSEKQILDFACNTYVPRITEMINDSIELVNDSVVPDTFFFRLDFIIEKFQKLVTIEDLIIFNPPPPSTQLDEVINKYDSIIQQFLERYVEDCAIKISKLKTKKGKINKIEKFSIEILKYKDNFTASHLEYINAVMENEFNIDFYENSNSSEITSDNYVLPYYLDNTEKITPEEIAFELKEWTRTGTLDKDEQYDSMIKELDIIKNDITWSKDLPNNNIEVCSKGLELSIKLCNYCIEHQYDKLKFVRSRTKNYYDYFIEQLEHWKVSNRYDEAKSLEKNGLFEYAIEKYLELLTDCIPLGSIYYESPFYLSINILNYESAHNIYNLLRDNFNKTQNKTLGHTLNNLTKIINSLETNENLYPKVKTEIFSIIENNPSILQSDLYKSFDSHYKESLRFIIYYLEKTNNITRQKKGRSYSLFLNN